MKRWILTWRSQGPFKERTERKLGESMDVLILLVMHMKYQENAGTGAEGADEGNLRRNRRRRLRPKPICAGFD